jgi:UDP-GlcNAc:undecaprenyl-phosphate/decaprenyl-phosphate GlcNAc-1-phosphate transferase
VAVGAFFGVTAIKIGYVSNLFGGIITLDTFQSLQWSIGPFTVFLIPLLVTIIWYVFVINVVNWSDNGHAMTSSLCLVTCIILALLCLKLLYVDMDTHMRANSHFVLTFLIVLIPALAVFWWQDIHRRCIIGDAGTMFLGLMIATLATVAGGKIATASIVLGIYCIDAVYVVINRLRQGKNPMKGDLSHLHHRMSRAGISLRLQRVLVMFFSFIFGL